MVIMHSRKEKKLLFPHFLCISLRESNCCRDVIFPQVSSSASPFPPVGDVHPEADLLGLVLGQAGLQGLEERKTEMQTFKMFAFLGM